MSTIRLGFAVSLVLHFALALPFVLRFRTNPPPMEASTLVVEVDGVVADSQAEEKILQGDKGGGETRRNGSGETRGNSA
jgi:protein TonB